MSIKEIGFKNTANIYSVSDSAKFGGDIGWVDERSLSKKILASLNDLDIKKYTPPIPIGNNFMILQLANVKKIKDTKNKDIELKKLIVFEENRQLNQFSKIYYNKIKINTLINEL